MKTPLSNSTTPSLYAWVEQHLHRHNYDPLFCILGIITIFSFNILGIYDDIIAYTSYISIAILTLVALVGKQYFISSLLVTMSIVPLWFMHFSPKYFTFCQLFILMYGNILGSYVQRLSNFILLAILGLIPWLVIMNFYKFEGYEDVIINYLEKDIAYTLAAYIVIAIFAFIKTQQRVYTSEELKTAIDELKTQSEKIENINSQLKQSLQDKDEFILLFSHDSRNPLNILLGNLSLLLSEAKKSYPQLLDKLEKCKFCSELLLQFLNNILDSGKLNNQGKLDINLSVTNINEFFLKNWRLMETMITKKSLKPKFSILNALPQHAKIDSQRVTQILLNLVGNATKFTEKGSVSLYVSYLAKEKIDEEYDYLPENMQAMHLLPNYDEAGSPMDLATQDQLDFEETFSRKSLRNVQKKELTRHFGTPTNHRKSSFFFNADQEAPGYLKLEVVDTGDGMSQIKMAKLFQKFSQVSDNANKRTIGTGLGLWISKSLCEQMEGGVRVFSKPNVGTCFTVLIKATAVAPKRSGGSGSKSRPNVIVNPNYCHENSGELRKMSMNRSPEDIIRVLIADDEPYNLELQRQFLVSLGITQVDAVSNGLELFNVFKEKPVNYYSFILSDIHMPIVDGREAIVKVREFEASEKRSLIPVGFITGHSCANYNKDCLAKPICARFVQSKPVDRDLLANLLEDVGIISPQSFSSNTNTPKWMTEERRLRVLCVDDDKFNLEYLKESLENQDTEGLIATSGEEAIKFVKESAKDIDLILMDCNMPGKDGWTTSYEIKTYLLENKLEDIPIYGVSGNDPSQFKDKATASKMDALYMKPLTMQKLSELLMQIRSP